MAVHRFEPLEEAGIVAELISGETIPGSFTPCLSPHTPVNRLDQHAALWVTGCVTTRTEWQPLDLSVSRFGVRATATALGMVPSMPMMSTLFVNANASAAKPRPRIKAKKCRIIGNRFCNARSPPLHPSKSHG